MAERIPVYHKGCGRIAFYTKRRWMPGDAMLASDTLLLDGSEPEPGSTVTCGHCKKQYIPGHQLTYDNPLEDKNA